MQQPGSRDGAEEKKEEGGRGSCKRGMGTNSPSWPIGRGQGAGDGQES